MAPDLSAPRRKGTSGRPNTCRTICLVGIVPFLVGLWVVLVTFRHGGLPTALRRGAGLAANCTGLTAQPSCKCPPDGGNGSDASAGVAQLASALSQRTVDKVLGAANASDPADQVVRVNEDTLEDVFLFVGILSGRGYRHRRLAVREAWANKCQAKGLSVCRFILSEDEMTPQVQKEVDTHGDIVFVKEKTNYKSILVKTFFVLEFAVANYDVRYILKTDDDAFINVGALLQQLRLLCVSPDCRQERLYMGRMAKESEVLLQPGHKWNNIVFHNHTGLKTYPNYMMGGGYVLSGDVSKTLININRKMRLKFTPIEDATLGFWLMSMDLRHIDHPKMFTWAAPCCFKAPVRREGQRIVTRFQLQDEMEADLCSSDPWLILHKIDSPTKMRYIGNRISGCNASDPDSVAPSIAAYVRQREGAEKEGEPMKGSSRAAAGVDAKVAEAMQRRR